eukprot:CAMPEP_0174740364 /NCGR_PEP_ID=MMETSP1094-20130205/73394_1 /TAXON_ID=156173 /ORGANISM="Chrysochromulina brevifilum, Strain UTEX LB 985" /LENGTH=67 /DNA_ID=CAMNT_0015944051 /DNA_START=8 /DNA_END=207 /DNA_ORIENTATION=+
MGSEEALLCLASLRRLMPPPTATAPSAALPVESLAKLISLLHAICSMPQVTDVVLLSISQLAHDMCT